MPEDAPGNPGAARPDAQPAPQGAVYRKVREMQAKLHRWAGEDHSRRFGDLFNLVCDLEFLAEGWLRVRANAGSRTPGIDALCYWPVRAVVAAPARTAPAPVGAIDEGTAAS